MGAVSWEVLAFRVGIDRVKGDVAFPLFVPRNVGATSTLEVKIFASAVVDAKLQNDGRSVYFFCSMDVQREAWGTHKRICERAMRLAMRSSLWPWLHCTTAYPRSSFATPLQFRLPTFRSPNNNKLDSTTHEERT